MDIAPHLQQHAVFYFTGQRSGAGLDAIEALGLRPALFARFHDLTRLRYDFPLVLVAGEADGELVRALSGVVDALLQEIAPAGIAGERLRRNVLRLEREIRVLLRDGASGTLSSLWAEAAARLVARGGEPVDSDLARARAALRVDGDILDCDGAMPARLVTHTWRAVQEAKARRVRGEIEALVVRLSDLVKADYLRSEAGRHAETLAAGVGSPHSSLFDFDAMSRLLAKPSGPSALPEGRRRRIEAALAVLRGQRFFATDGGHCFRFDSTGAAIAAFGERLPEMAALVRAMAIAELELQGRYDEAKHDPVFAAYGPGSMRTEDRALFPDFLVCEAGGPAGAAPARLMDALSSGVPLKVLVETSELLDESASADGHFGVGARLAGSAMGLDDVFVLQSAASNLYRVRGKLRAAMEAPGAALLSVYSPAGTRAGGPAPYLVAAAAMESRAFPAFCYDPGAGADWATRFSLEGNPQPDRAWPLHELTYADTAMQRVAEALPFTLADFAACEPHCARHFARARRESWNASMVPVGDWLARASNGVPETVPCVYAIDGDGRLEKLIIDEKLVHAARRCADAWRRLQELGAFARERAPAPAAAAVASEAPAEQGKKRAPAAAADEPPQEAREPGEPYIETPRCSSCNECINLNNVMFAYNENQQAYIANPDGGSYRELVEAAESCQVAVIHPGKPRNPKEDGLEALVKRAAAFQ